MRRGACTEEKLGRVHVRRRARDVQRRVPLLARRFEIGTTTRREQQLEHAFMPPERGQVQGREALDLVPLHLFHLLPAEHQVRATTSPLAAATKK